MTTRDTIQGYFSSLKQKKGWESFLSDEACALTRYQLQPPAGPVFGSDVAEVFGVRDGKISSLDIYFDSSPFPK